VNRQKQVIARRRDDVPIKNSTWRQRINDMNTTLT